MSSTSTAPEGSAVPTRENPPFSDRQLEQLESVAAAAVEERFQSRSQAEIDAIAEKAATMAVEKMTDQAFQAVGKAVLTKLAWIVGVLLVGGYLWAQNHGWLGSPKP